MGRRRRRPNVDVALNRNLNKLAADLRAKRQKSWAGKQERLAVLVRHARLKRNGKIMYCYPSPQAPDDDPTEWHSLGKVIFDTCEAAVAADKELQQLGYVHLVPYECPRSQHGHHHLRNPKGHGADAR